MNLDEMDCGLCVARASFNASFKVTLPSLLLDPTPEATRENVAGVVGGVPSQPNQTNLMSDVNFYVCKERKKRLPNLGRA